MLFVGEVDGDRVGEVDGDKVGLSVGLCSSPFHPSAAQAGDLVGLSVLAK